MKPPPFEYTAPNTLEEVLDLLGEHGDEAKILAGGQSLMPMLAHAPGPPRPPGRRQRCRVARRHRRTVAAIVAFGAMTREREAERSPLVADRIPVLAEALPFIGHVSIRNRGTIGGSIAHADASAELPAVAVVTEAEMVRARPPRRARRRRPTTSSSATSPPPSPTTSASSRSACRQARRPPAGRSRRSPAATATSPLVGVAAMVTLDGDGDRSRPRASASSASPTGRCALATVEAALVGAAASPDTFAAAAADAVARPGAGVRRRTAPPRTDATSPASTVRRALTAAAERAGGPT